MNKNLWQRFKAGLFTKAQFITGVSIFVLISSAVIYAYDVLNFTPFVAGTTISAGDMNAKFLEVNNKMKRLNNKFVVGLNANLNITYPYGDTTAITPFFNTVLIDASGHSYGAALVNNSSFIVQDGGVYDITLTGQAGITTLNPAIRLMKFPTTVLASVAYISNSFNFASNKHYLNSGDVVYINVFDWESGVSDVVSINGPKTKLVIEKID